MSRFSAGEEDLGFEVNLAIRIKYYLKMAKTKIVPTNIREVLSHSMKQFNHEMEYYFQKRKAIETSVALKLKMFVSFQISWSQPGF